MELRLLIFHIFAVPDMLDALFEPNILSIAGLHASNMLFEVVKDDREILDGGVNCALQAAGQDAVAFEPILELAKRFAEEMECCC